VNDEVRAARCPECGGGNLRYEKEQHEVEHGPLVAVKLPTGGAEPTPVVDDTSDDSYTRSSDEECVECRACGAAWGSWDDFLGCFLADDHEEECVL
jgi:hypothetical protein